MRVFLLLLPTIFWTFHLSSQDFERKEESMVVNSGEAQYDGKEITLVGEVVVQHGLGQISAHRLSFQPHYDKDQKSQLGVLKISDHIEILLKEGGKLNCQQAEVDYSKMQGIFLGDSNSPDVTYSLSGEEQTGETPLRSPFELRSLKMTLNLVKETSENSSSKIMINQIEASSDVRVRYNNDYTLLADHAIYQRLPKDPSSLAGDLTLTAKHHLPHCKMTNLNGDRLSAQKIQLSTNNRQLVLTNPFGTLFFRREGIPLQSLEFSSQELTWSDRQQQLIFDGNVHIRQNEVLNIDTEHQLILSQSNANGKKTLRSMHAPQNTRISYQPAQHDNLHRITCPGPFTIDHEKQEMTMERNSSFPYSQVHLDDIHGEMQADYVNLQYQWNEKELLAGRMILEGNVKLTNRFDGHLEESGSILHYVLADRVDYFPESQEMVLTASNGNRVLFFDKVNNVQMSAPSLKVKHDVATNKQAVQGMGDVRFTFIDKEFDQMKHFFPKETWSK